jgi:hypothetical protein
MGQPSVKGFGDQQLSTPTIDISLLLSQSRRSAAVAAPPSPTITRRRAHEHHR